MSVSRSSRRYFDPRFQATIITVAPGEHEITSAKDEIVATVLGSCVSVCMRDPIAGVGGLNHFLLPKNNGNADPSAGERYGDTAMEVLINDLLKRGAKRSNFEAKVFGGARALSGDSERILPGKEIWVATAASPPSSRPAPTRAVRPSFTTPAVASSRRASSIRTSISNRRW